MYNNFLYALAARVGEKLAGQTWEQLVQTMLLDVIGMKETSFINETNIDVATPSEESLQLLAWMFTGLFQILLIIFL